MNVFLFIFFFFSFGKKMSDNIKVAIKVRPLIKREKEEQAKIQWTVQENTISHIGPKIGKADSTYQFGKYY